MGVPYRGPRIAEDAPHTAKDENTDRRTNHQIGNCRVVAEHEYRGGDHEEIHLYIGGGEDPGGADVHVAVTVPAENANGKTALAARASTDMPIIAAGSG